MKSDAVRAVGAFIIMGIMLLVAGFFLRVSPVGICGWGWLPVVQEGRIDFVRSEFRENLPPNLALDSFECLGSDGFQASVEFRISAHDGPGLMAELDRTFAEPQNRPFFSDDGKTRREARSADGLTTFYMLPSNGFLRVREIEIHAPVVEGAAWKVRFNGYER